MEFLSKGISFISHHYAGIGMGCLLLAASCMIFSYRTSLRIHTPS